MKTKVYQSSFCRSAIALMPFIFLFIACKKEEAVQSKINSSAVNTIVGDGIVTVQASILPPATPQTFIASGDTYSGSSIAEFQVTSSQQVYLYSMGLSASYPLIAGIVTDNFHPNNNGFCGSSLGGYVYPNQGSMIQVEALYNAVDSATSGSIVHLTLTQLEYRTADEIYHTIDLGNLIKAQDMCLVYNVPHISFQNPSKHTVGANLTEIADIKLSGDTDWTLNSLPLFLSSGTQAYIAIPNSQLIIKYQGNKIATKSTAIDFNGNSPVQTVVDFTKGFHHVAGHTEILRVYAKITHDSNPGLLYTKLYPFSSLKWTDGLGAVIPGAKNAKFFKEDPGIAAF